MCSISGFLASSPIASPLATLITNGLLFYGRARGRQSGGTCLINSTNTAKLYKAAKDPKLLIDTPDHRALFDLPDFSDGIQAALCHTRTPTCGGLGDAQAQPFLIQGASGPTITTHNGHYSDFDSIKAAHSITKPSGVDSELAASYVAAHGAETLPTFITSTDGPSSIACWHTDSLYFIRADNPLSYTFISLSSTNLLVWASTPEILKQALYYVWLWDSSPTIHSTDNGILYKASPTTLTALTTSPVTPTWPSYSNSSSSYTSPQHLCPYTNTTISMYHQLCKCQISRASDGTFTAHPDPRYPVPTHRPTLQRSLFDPSDPVDSFGTDFDDPAQDFWFSDALNQLPDNDRTDFLARLNQAQITAETMTPEDWTALGQYWPLILEAAADA